MLTEEGYSYWFQDQDFKGSIPGNIAKAQEQSVRTIVVLSEAYARSGYGRSEWQMRYQEDPGGEKDLLILFRIGPCPVEIRSLAASPTSTFSSTVPTKLQREGLLSTGYGRQWSRDSDQSWATHPIPERLPVNAPYPVSGPEPASSGSGVGGEHRAANPAGAGRRGSPRKASMAEGASGRGPD